MAKSSLAEHSDLGFAKVRLLWRIFSDWTYNSMLKGFVRGENWPQLNSFIIGMGDF
jgi:hypothetical protein